MRDNYDDDDDDNEAVDRPDISGSRICEGKRTPSQNDNSDKKGDNRSIDDYYNGANILGGQVCKG